MNNNVAYLHRIKHKERQNLVNAATTNASFLMELYEEIDQRRKKNSFLMDKEIGQLRKKNEHLRKKN